MPGNAQPLVNSVKVVNDDGTPTDYFIRWAQERQIDITAGITAAQAQQLIDDWAAARDIIAGVGLSGGGNLAADVTIDHADSAVTPNTYGDATHVAQITVDQQGHVTDVQEVAISGGGGGGLSFWPAYQNGSIDTNGYATKGHAVRVTADCTIHGITFATDEVGDGTRTFRGTIATCNPATGQITTILDTTVSLTPITGARNNFFLPFASPLSLTAGTDYMIAVSRTDSTGTTPMRLTGNGVAGPVGPMQLYFSGGQRKYNTTSLSNGQSPSLSTGNDTYTLGLVGTYP